MARAIRKRSLLRRYTRDKFVSDNHQFGILCDIANSGNNTQFSYDALSRATKIDERTAGSVTSTKQHIWSTTSRCEERNGTGGLSDGKMFAKFGQVNFAGNSATSYFYAVDHLSSVREMTKSVTGTTSIEAQYKYAAYGEVTKVAGNSDSDFQFGAYFNHSRSGLSLTIFRAYSAILARFICRDPIFESGGLNLFAYTLDNPIGFTDPLGLECPKGPLLDAIIRKFEKSKVLQEKTSMGGLETGGAGVWNNGKFTGWKWGTPLTSSSFDLDPFQGMTDVIQNHRKVPPLNDYYQANNPDMTAKEDVQKAIDNSSRLWTLGSDGDITMYNGTTHTGQCTVQVCIYDGAGNLKKECKADCNKMGTAH